MQPTRGTKNSLAAAERENRLTRAHWAEIAEPKACPLPLENPVNGWRFVRRWTTRISPRYREARRRGIVYPRSGRCATICPRGWFASEIPFLFSRRLRSGSLSCMLPALAPNISRVLVLSSRCIVPGEAKTDHIWKIHFSNMTMLHEENFMAILTILSVVIWFYTRTLEIFATLGSVITMRMGICDTLDITIIPILCTSILFVLCILRYV